MDEIKHKDKWINKVMAMNNLKTAHIKAGEVLNSSRSEKTLSYQKHDNGDSGRI